MNCLIRTVFVFSLVFAGAPAAKSDPSPSSSLSVEVPKAPPEPGDSVPAVPVPAPGSKYVPPAPGTAVAAVESGHSLLANGDFQKASPDASWPADWTKPKVGHGLWGDENGNRFLRLETDQPDAVIMSYQLVPIPPETKALKLTWRQRLTNFRAGPGASFNARILMEFRDAAGSKLPQIAPSPVAKGNTKDWQERQTAFLVPDGAKTLVFMPSLFRAASGTYDLDDIALVPIDPAPVEAGIKALAGVKAAAVVPPEPADKSKWPEELHVEGNRVFGKSGKEVWLQGISTSGWEVSPTDGFVTKAAKVGVEDWKANIVRVPVKEEYWFGKNSAQKDGGAQYRKNVDDLITVVANRGAYILLDLHRYRTPTKEHADFWKDAAARYKDHPAVLFDIFNEPHGTTWEVWRNGGPVALKPVGVDEAPFLTPEEKAKRDAGITSVGMQGLVDAVRGTGARNIIVAGGLAYANDLSGVLNGFALDDRDGHGIMYSWHVYNWHKGWQKHALDVAEKYPILVGELGADEMKMDFLSPESQEDPATWVPDILGCVQKYKLHWTGWCMHPTSSPRMVSDWYFTPTPFWGIHVKDALAGKQFEIKSLR